MQHELAPEASAWLAENIVQAMAAEANSKEPRETGGVLLGYWGTQNGEPVVTNIVGPGPNATHSLMSFVPDYRFQQLEVARLYEESHRRLHYLGDWHTHPNGGGNLSALDRRALRAIARSHGARARHPVMVVLAGGPEWSLHVWQHDWVDQWCVRWQIVRPLSVKVFETDVRQL